MSSIKRRRPYPTRRRPRKTVFTPAMWQRWLSEQSWANQQADAQRVQLRAGIDEFRQRVLTGRERAVHP
jgi:hypothetical protein